MGKNVPGLKRGFHYDPVARDLGIYVNGVQVESYSEFAGRIYYVNNITGASTNDGRSWGSAFAQVSEAISASETYRLLGVGKPDVTTNDYIRNTIVVQGTGTAYTVTTGYPNYCNIIGLGADPRGNGAGIARVDGAGAADSMATGSTGVRGWNMYNMQLTHSSGGAYYGADIAKIYRSRFENCVFFNGESGGMRIETGGSVVINDCVFGSDTYDNAYGLYIGTGATFNHSKITNSEFHGSTAAFYILVSAASNTRLDNCMFMGGTHGCIDAMTQSSMHHLPFYTNCYAFGSHSSTINEAGFETTESYGLRFMACIDNANGTSRNYPTTAD